jgi:phosphoribosylformylglycinamidine cyclo-ligase
VLAAARRGLLRSAAHITGGGLVENIPRALPNGLGADLDRTAWEPGPVFGFVQGLADVSDEEMARTFNMGLGMVLVTAQEDADAAARAASDAGFEATRAGTVTDEPGVRLR